MKIRCLNCMQEYEQYQNSGICPYCGFKDGAPPLEAYHLYPGIVLAGRYLVGTVINVGGFGIIYRAWDQTMNRLVAVKEFFPSASVNRIPERREVFCSDNYKKEFESGKKGFLEEARNTARFSNYPNIVNIYDYFEENNTAYIVMEYMPGMTLKEYMKQKGGKIPWQEAVFVASSIADSLDIVHKAGIIHRDISPANIRLIDLSHVKLFDFGAARFSDNNQEVIRQRILTQGYAPPEQYRIRSKQDDRTDIYALGATLYHAITGVLPKSSVDREASVKKGTGDILQRVKELEPEIPDYIDIAVMKAMALEPGLRFKNVLQFKNALLNRGKWYDPETEVKRKKRLRGIGIAGVLLLCVTGIIGAVFMYHKQEQRANLVNTNITVWVRGDKERKETFYRMAEEFLKDYPQVSFEVVAFAEPEYDQKLLAALQTKENMPVLFEISDNMETYSEFLLDLESFYASLDSNVYCNVFQAAQKDKEPKYVPLGWDVPLLYWNELDVDEKEEQRVSTDKTAFLEKETPVFLGSCGDYYDVQKSLPGIYGIKPAGALDSKMDVIIMTDCFAVSADSNTENREAGKRLLTYYLGENAQKTLFLDSHGSVPVNLREFKAYWEVYPELAFLEEADRSVWEKTVIGTGEFEDMLSESKDELMRNAANLSEYLQTD